MFVCTHSKNDLDVQSHEILLRDFTKRVHDLKFLRIQASMNAAINASKKNLDQAFELYKQLFQMRATHDPHVSWLADSAGGRLGASCAA